MKNFYVSIIRRGELCYIRRALEEFGLNPMEGGVIRLLKDHCCSQEALGCALDVDKGRIARTIASLEDKKLVYRVVNDCNHRQKMVSLTEPGNDIYEAICGIYKSWDDICHKGFSDEEKKLNQEFIKRVSQNVLDYKKENGGKLNG